jgi:hypothetical protein
MNLILEGIQRLDGPSTCMAQYIHENMKDVNLPIFSRD